MRSCHAAPQVSGEASIGDLLTAASILAALLTFLYGNAYATISKAVDVERGERRRADLRPKRRQLLRALWPAVAVLVTSVALAVVFARECSTSSATSSAIWDAIGLSLVVVWLAFLAVAAHAAGSTFRLATKYCGLNRAP